MRIALGIAYNGTAYHGWQSQSQATSIQAHIERVLTSIANQAITVNCAGRTDAKVHATCQVVHFDTMSQRKITAWILGCNSLLPKDIAVNWAMPVPDIFHARFSAQFRRYRYLIYNNRSRPAILADGLSWYPQALDAHVMHRAAQHLLGEQDFSSFRAARCQSNGPMRNVHHIKVHRQGLYIMIDIQANAFLYHMVRIIAGVLIHIGSGQAAENWSKQVLEARDRSMANVTAHPEGLYLVKVQYPSHFNLPETPMGPLIL